MFKGKLLPAITLGGIFLLAGCGDDSSSPTQESTNTPEKTEVDVVTGCEEITDEADKAEMQKAKESVIDVYTTFGDGDLVKAQKVSAETKTTIQNILKKYPGSCEAQLAYVASIISDIANNQKINNLVDTLLARTGKPGAALFSRDIEDASQISLNLSFSSSDELRNILVSDVQAAIASAIPSLDSAISYMTNIANDDAFTCSYTVDERLVELDRGEFGPALGALYAAKAILTSVVSINLNIDDNGKYDWVDSIEKISTTWDYAGNAGIKQLVKLVGKDSKLTSIHNEWKSEYKGIPDLLDSAISYVQYGLQYGLEEAKNGLETQENDLYIVGDDENADLSTADAQKVIDSLGIIREQIKTGFDIPYAEGKTFKFIPAKWFENTDGILKFLPYHVINDMALWNTPDGGLYWSEALEYQAYAQRYMQSHVAQSYSKYNPTAKSIEIYGWDEDETTGKIFMEVYNPEDIEAEITYQAEGCTMHFQINDYREGYDNGPYLEQENSQTATTWTIPDAKLPEGMCREKGGVAEYAVAYNENEVPNILYFTDAKGNKTVTLQALINGKLEGEEPEPYSLDEIKSFIVFPDITFGGVFPEMTSDFFWDELVPALMDDDEEEEDYYEEY